MANSNLIHFVFPLKDNRHLVDFVNVLEDSFFEFRFCFDSEGSQKRPGGLAKKRFNDIEPRPMGWSKDELEAVWNGSEISFCFFGDVRRMIIENHSNLDIRGIDVIKSLKKIGELCASMPVLNISMDVTRKKINGGQKGNDAMSFIFIVPSDGRMLSRNWGKVRGHILDRLNPWSFIVRKHGNIRCFLVFRIGGPNHLHLLIGQKDLGHF